LSADQSNGDGAFHYALSCHYGIGIDVDLEEAAKYYELAATSRPLIGSDNSFRCQRGLSKAEFSAEYFRAEFREAAAFLEDHRSARPYIIRTQVSDYLTTPSSSPALPLIGTGGSSTVLLQKDPVTDRDIAVKRIFSQGYDETVFLREIETLIKLNHPCVVRIHGCVLPRETRYPEIHMEYAVNGSLRSVFNKIKHGTRPAFWNSTGIGIIICGIVFGMRYVHSRGFIHRDLKPENILINRNGHPLIADFGTTRPVEDRATLTPETGTVYYAAPEMYRESENICPKVDVFSFGLILYEILAGRPVFPSDEQPFPVMRQLFAGEMPAVPDNIGSFMHGLILRCWSLDPANRPSFDDIVNDFETCEFNISPGSSSDTIKEYFCSIKAWETTPNE
jgi:serine/threonine protein kinase